MNLKVFILQNVFKKPFSDEMSMVLWGMEGFERRKQTLLKIKLDERIRVFRYDFEQSLFLLKMVSVDLINSIHYNDCGFTLPI